MRTNAPAPARVPPADSTLPTQLHQSRDGRLLLFVHAGLGLVRGSYLFAVPWVVLQRGLGADIASWMLALVLAGQLLSAYPSARISGVGSRRPLLLAAAAASAVVVSTVLAWELLSGRSPVLLLASGVLVFGLANGALLAASYPAAETLVAPAAMRGAHAQLNTLDQLSVLGAGAVGVAALQVMSFVDLLTAQTVAMTAVLGAALLLRLPHRSAGTEPPPQSLRQTLASADMRRLYAAGMAWNFAAGAFAGTVVAWLQLELELEAGLAAVVMGAGAVGSIASGVILSQARLRVATPPLLWGAMALHAALLASAALLPAGSLALTAVVVAVLMLGSSSVAGLFVTARAEVCDPAHRAAVLVLGQTLHRLALFFSYLLAGALVQPLGFSVLYVAAAGAIGALAAGNALTRRARQSAVTM